MPHVKCLLPINNLTFLICSSFKASVWWHRRGQLRIH